MHRRYGLKVLLTALVVMSSAFACMGVIARFHSSSAFPLDLRIIGSHTAVVESIPYAPLPATLKVGDRIDFVATPRSTRIALEANTVAGTHVFAIERDGKALTIPVTAVDVHLSSTLGAWWNMWSRVIRNVLFSAIALLALWRGRDRAAAGLALWAITVLAVIAVGYIPLGGIPGFSASFGTKAFAMLGRVGFYVLIESMVGSALTPRARRLWRAGFLLFLGLGIVQSMGGPSSS